MAEFTSKLSERVSDHINRIWPSHLINIKFNCNADFITIVVEDKNAKNRFYKMNQRSEGFKQFVSLMLSLSAKNNGDLLRNNVIIIDEPENHLHPGGIVEMRNELLKIGKNNQMIISTHSNFMVDTTTMERHWLLIKNTETILKQIDESTSLFDEEVVSRAFGIEIMKELIPNNIIVCEGHSDKLVIELMLNQLSQNLSYSIKSAGGCSKVYSVCSILAAEKFKPFVFLDSDNEGVKAKSDITNNLKETYKGNVKTLADLGLKTQNASIEDLYPREYVKNWILSNYSVDIDNFIDLAVIDSLKAQGIKDKEQLKKLKTKLSEDFVNHYKDKTLFMNEAENLVSIGKKFIELLKTN
jgi:predicted ATP-dependent endonuclease of OLD family